MTKKPIVLVLGSTGQIGKIIVNHLIKDKSVSLRVTTRRKEQVQELKEKYGDAVFMDLNDPRTFDEALKNVDRLFLLTGYTVDMIVQSKAIIDSAKRLGIKHIIHLGVFSKDLACYDPHFAWHIMIESYIQQSGIPYTFLHPNCFLQNFTGMYGLARKGKLHFYGLDKKVGWIALEDVGEAAAKILIEGPAKHNKKDYWFSTDSLNIHEVAKIFSDVTGKVFEGLALSPDLFLKELQSKEKCIDAYFIGVYESFKQIVDGRMAYIADVQDDLPLILGRKGLDVKSWATLHKEAISKLA
jgi:NAD(P)H dehydrogenase (quinone)